VNFLLDTNIINYLLRGNGTVRERFDAVAGGFLLSPVVDFEIRRYLLLKQATRNLRQYEALVESWIKLELNHSD
jgi:predicted nucleic acid-binding protein